MLGRLRRVVEDKLLYRPGLIGKGNVSLIDVGSIGALPSPWRENPGRIKHLLKFEPRDIAGTSPFIRTMDCALGADDGPRRLYIYKGLAGSGSSFYEQNVDYVRQHYETLSRKGPSDLAQTWFERSALDRVETVSCRRLDSVLAELGDEAVYHFLKVDAQGAEYEILKGAEVFLAGSCVGLHLELFTVPLYKEMVLLDEVDRYLKNYRFSLVKKYPAHGSFDSQHDCVFLKEDSGNELLEVVRDIYRLV